MRNTVKLGELGRNTLRSIKLVWKAYPWFTIAMAGVTMVRGVLPAANAWIGKLFVDKISAIVVTSSRPSDGSFICLLGLAGLQAALLLITTFLSTADSAGRSFVGENIRNRIQTMIFQKVSGFPIRFFEQPWFYDQLQRAHQEIGQRPLAIISSITAVIEGLITITSMVWLLSRYSWFLIPIIVFSMLPVLLVEKRFGENRFQLSRERTAQVRRQSYAGSILTSSWYIKEIRLFGLEEFFTALHQSVFKEMHNQNNRLLKKQSVAKITASVVASIGWFLAIAYAVFSIWNHTITLGDFALINQAVSQSQTQLGRLLGEIATLYSNSLYIGNLFGFLNLPGHKQVSTKVLTEPIVRIEFQDVSFIYPDSPKPVFEHINFILERGKVTMLAGRNGTGKSTIVKLVCGLYETSGGRILINGSNMQEYSTESIQSQMSILLQDFGRYQMRAYENIGLGNIKNISNRSEIIEAGIAGCSDEFINLLPDGYDSMLGKLFDGGTELSVGQWQRIALSRCLIHPSNVLILDEPTAFLDIETKEIIYQKLHLLAKDRIVFLVSHGLSQSNVADKLLQLNGSLSLRAAAYQSAHMSASG